MFIWAPGTWRWWSRSRRRQRSWPTCTTRAGRRWSGCFLSPSPWPLWQWGAPWTRRMHSGCRCCGSSPTGCACSIRGHVFPLWSPLPSRRASTSPADGCWRISCRQATRRSGSPRAPCCSSAGCSNASSRAGEPGYRSPRPPIQAARDHRRGYRAALPQARPGRVHHPLPDGGVIAAYEARYSLHTMARAVPGIMLTLVPS